VKQTRSRTTQSLVRYPEANAVWLGTTTDAKSRLSEVNDAKSVHKKPNGRVEDGSMLE